MNDKEKMLKKTKIIFLVEFLLIGSVLLVIGFLKLFGIINQDPKRLLAYNIITTIGGVYIIFDLVWCLVSKKKRAKTSFIDKILTTPAGLYLLVFDILCFTKIYNEPTYIKYSISSVLIYAGVISLFMGIYHYFKPTKQILEAVEEEYLEKQKELAEKNNKEEQEKE